MNVPPSSDSLDPETGSILGTAGAVITITINH